MRILYTFTGGSGHLLPILAIARAAQTRGHDVAVAGSGSMVAAIEFHGFTAFPTSEPGSRPRSSTAAQVEPIGPEREDETMRVGFAGRGARRHVEMMPPIIREFEPNVLVRDEVDFGTAAVAELLDIPCATVLVLAAGSFPAKSPRSCCPWAPISLTTHNVAPSSVSVRSSTRRTPRRAKCATRRNAYWRALTTATGPSGSRRNQRAARPWSSCSANRRPRGSLNIGWPTGPGATLSAGGSSSTSQGDQ